MTFLDLPEDILSLVYLYLSPKDFLALCSSSKVLYTNYHKDPLFWRSTTSATFRIPISPLLKADGARWYSLYRRLKTQTRLYTWGQGLKGNLGHGIGARHSPPGLPGRRARIGGRVILQPPRLVFQRTTSTWPTEAHVPDEVGVIADLQCGGWSTIILSSAGGLYATGSINSANYINVGSQTDRFERLEYLTQSTSAISQFSAGRTHVLALNDDGEILTWDRINAKGLKVYSRYGGKFSGKPKRVVAGWAESSTFVPELGLIYWQPLQNDQAENDVDGRIVQEKVIPHTAEFRLDDDTLVTVTAHILLEGILLWINSKSQLWACDIGHENREDTEPRSPPVQIPGFVEGDDQLKDVQGSFRNFVVFTAQGRVLAGSTDYIRQCLNAARTAAINNMEQNVDTSNPSSWTDLDEILSRRPRDVPALQNTGVVSVRFGDWHFQALHSNGKITSHGHEPESCGALGLGEAFHGGKLRGLHTGRPGMRQDSFLRPVADLRGRQIWFETEKREWLEHLQSTAQGLISAQHPNADYLASILDDPTKQTMFSEWIEQEGRRWEDGPATQNANLQQATKSLKIQDDEDFHLDSYFAIAIGAAGWHSGALVLVDDEKAEQVRQKWISLPAPKVESDDKVQEEAPNPMPGQFPVGAGSEEEHGPQAVWLKENFPRIRFPDGSESPLPDGESSGQTLRNALRPWRDGPPTLQELGLSG